MVLYPQELSSAFRYVTGVNRPRGSLFLLPSSLFALPSTFFYYFRFFAAWKCCRCLKLLRAWAWAALGCLDR